MTTPEESSTQFDGISHLAALGRLQHRVEDLLETVLLRAGEVHRFATFVLSQPQHQRSIAALEP